MTPEEKLKDLILSRYRSIREFTIAIDMPYTTIDSIFRRGIGNSSVSNVIKICKALGISADALANGEIAPKYEISSEPVTDVKEIINDTKAKLSHVNHLTIDGIDISVEYVEPIIDALDIGYEMVKRKSSKAKSSADTLIDA